MKLVKFSNGAFGIQQPDMRFVDLKFTGVAWNPGEKNFKDCCGDEGTARAIYNKYVLAKKEAAQLKDLTYTVIEDAEADDESAG